VTHYYRLRYSTVITATSVSDGKIIWTLISCKIKPPVDCFKFCCSWLCRRGKPSKQIWWNPSTGSFSGEKGEVTCVHRIERMYMFALSARCNHVGSGFKFYMNMNEYELFERFIFFSNQHTGKTLRHLGGFWRLVAQRRGITQGCAFSGLEYWILTFDPPFAPPPKKKLKFWPRIGNFYVRACVCDCTVGWTQWVCWLRWTQHPTTRLAVVCFGTTENHSVCLLRRLLWIRFYRATLCVSAVFAVARYLSVRLSVVVVVVVEYLYSASRSASNALIVP